MDAAHHDVLIRLRAEYLEMPGLRLNIQQVQRLCGVNRARSQAVLNDLVVSRFLCRMSDGSYARAVEGVFPRARPVKADLDAVVEKAKARRTGEGWR
jgi:hypothetical protein